MSMSSIGDLARTLMFQNRSTEIRNEISKLTQELASGRVADVSDHLKGDFSHLADVERSLERLGTLSNTAAETGLFATTVQRSLENLDNRTGDLANSLTAIGNFGQDINRTQASNQAKSELGAMIGSLNQAVAGRSLFAGIATDQVPLESSDRLLQEVRTVIAGSATADDAITAARNWFNDPAGFETVIYRGSTQSLAPISVGENNDVTLDLRADNATIRTVLLNTTLAALATDAAVGLSDAEQTDLLKKTGSGLVNARDDIVGLRADVGHAEARIDQAKSRNSATKTSLEFARNKLIGADPFEVTTRLQSVQVQLQSLYTVTARTSSLNLVNFLR
ncbi:flagellar hook-associated protein FlgL [Falsiruegeria litorea R37]|uniref:Flagellar hook-associated protein FlgL n=1 Tax=Falsiruegeria litorea R37 TaxID=1200284 RepID=A0A1Y5TM59_9RHOB|nr:flagellin [Falsiruegeria litorea]SLN63568.1 flagellar hook-associated protein FlgL [Falsiruegeria litorea R37]